MPGLLAVERNFQKCLSLFQPQVHIRDFAVQTDFDPSYQDATLSVKAKIFNNGNEASRDDQIEITVV